MRGKSYYNDKRQIINMGLVQTGDYDETLLLCIPKFAWDVARAFLARQGLWRSTYAMAYHDNYYETPDDAEMDIIDACISELLSEDDMSCDLVTALEGINETLLQLAQSAAIEAASQSTLCCGGSQGAGGTQAPPVDFEQDETNYPDDFESRVEFVAWKCNAAGKIADVLITDMKWLQNTDVTGITATFLVATLLTPVPGDEVIVAVGAIAVMVLEGVLDTVLGNIIDAIEEDRDEIVCFLYDAIDSNSAIAAFESWAAGKLSALEATFLGYFINTDVINWLFSKVNLILGTEDCSGCAACTPEWEFWPEYIAGWPDAGSGNLDVNGTQRTLTAVLMPNGYYYLIAREIGNDCPTRIRCVSIGGNNAGGGGSPIYAGYDQETTSFSGGISSVAYTAEVILGE